MIVLSNGRLATRKLTGATASPDMLDMELKQAAGNPEDGPDCTNVANRSSCKPFVMAWFSAADQAANP